MTADAPIRALHAHPLRLVVAVTGGGSDAIRRLLEVPGASQTVLAAHVPYAEAALCAYLGQRPERFCSPGAARAMAMAAYREALRLGEAQPVAGFGATCSLASDRPKRGPHRIHLAAQTATTTETWSLELTKDVRSRAAEEALTGELLLDLMAATAGIPERIAPPLLAGESVVREQTIACGEWQELLADKVDAVWHRGGRRGATLGRYAPLADAPDTPQPPRALLCGAFHPLHTGHREMAAVAAQELGVPVAFEIATHNVDKLPLDFTDMAERLRQFDLDQTVWFTRVGTFVGKARLFPGVTFVTGVDTIERIAEARYYPAGDRDAALAEIDALGCRFLVFGRQGPGGFRTLADLTLPPALAAMATGVQESAFRRDISSTEIRQRAGE